MAYAFNVLDMRTYLSYLSSRKQPVLFAEDEEMSDDDRRMQEEERKKMQSDRPEDGRKDTDGEETSAAM